MPKPPQGIEMAQVTQGTPNPSVYFCLGSAPKWRFAMYYTEWTKIKSPWITLGRQDMTPKSSAGISAYGLLHDTLFVPEELR